jgi:protein involved in polysaccharide export with SLBB domain/outer membrane lipoprotein SlyB
MSTRSKKGIVMAGCLAVLMIVGCAQQKAYEAPPQSAKADGLVVAGKFRAVVIEDMDSDGNLDVVGGASSPGLVTISYGDGKGAISEAQILPVNGEVLSIAVADFNEDGLNDIVFSVDRETTGIRLWINQSNRQWKQQNGPTKIDKYQNLETADVNGDGHMDVVGANSTSDSQAGVQVWLGNGKAGWITESGPTTTGRYMDTTVADLNKDGRPDLVAAGWGQYGAVQVWLGDGTGKWSSTSPLNKGSYYGVSVGDVNGDGNLDILAAAYQAGIHFFLGDGRGDFVKVKDPLAKGESFWEAMAVDLNGDSVMDVVASSLDSMGIRAFRNKNHSGWQPYKDLFPNTGIYYGLALADLNADGALDICAASYGEGIQIWPGNTGKAIIFREQGIEQLPAAEQLAVLAAPLENDVFKTVNGIAQYKIGPGDVLEITSWEGSTSKKEEIVVRQDGKISFSFVEDLSVTGLTASQLDELLTEKLRRYLRQPRVDVVVKEYNSKSVTLLGAVAFRGVGGTGPGKYRLSGKTTLIEMLTQAGGFDENAALQRVNIRRKNGQSISLDLFKAIHQGDPGKDFVLDNKDVVFIPTLAKDGNRVYVFGEVEKPGVYTFEGSDMRLADAISEAGGPTVFASEAETRVVRGDITQPEIITANLKQLIEKGDQSQNLMLANRDLIYVPRNGYGGINIFFKRIKPLLELIVYPARTVMEYDRAYDVINGNGD